MLHAGSAAVDRALLPTRFKLGNYNCRYRPKITVAAQTSVCPRAKPGARRLPKLFILKRFFSEVREETFKRGVED